MRSLLIAILAFSLMGLVACKKETTPPAGGDTKAPVTKPAEPAAADAEKIPVAADFEEHAAKEITADNYEQELDKMEKELSASD